METREDSIRIQTLGIITLISTVVVGFFLIYTGIKSIRQFDNLRNAMDEYVICEKETDNLLWASSYLTTQSRLYVATGNEVHMENYLQEVTETKRREQAVETLEKHYADTKAFLMLKKAEKSSLYLMETEYTAMKLAAIGYGLQEIPEPINSMEISQADLQLSKEAQIEKALDMICNVDYETYKNIIADDAANSASNLLLITKEKQDQAREMFIRAFTTLVMELVFFILVLLVNGHYMRSLVLTPLKKYEECVKAGKPARINGAAEIISLSKAYNQVLEQSKQQRKDLKESVQHDSLTGALNWQSFVKTFEELKQEKEDYALLLLNLDSFKTLNEKYGYENGDLILKRVAELLQFYFSSKDYIARINGNEFAVIVPGVKPQEGPELVEIISNINAELNYPEGDMPASSISAGISFSEKDKPNNNIYSDAEEALFEMKKNGRNGCRIR